MYDEELRMTTITGTLEGADYGDNVDRDLAAGVYLVTVTAGSTMRTERLVIQR